MRVEQHTIEVGGASVFCHRAGDAKTLCLHSVPTSADDWLGLLAAAGGIAPDLPGFGRTDKPGNLDYSLNGYVTFVERLLDALELERVAIVGHGWGAAIGLMLAERSPERVARIAIVNAVPLLEGFKWPRVARWLRAPGLGELLMGSVARWSLARLLRSACVSADAWPQARIDAVWDQFDQGTQRAILRLHRSVSADSLPVAGAGLDQLQQPALVVWGERDPWLPASFAQAYGARLRNATVELVPDAGHWPWLDRPALTERLARFASGGAATLSD